MTEDFKTLAIALGLGLLVGLQRERAESPIAGFRTFPMLTVFGTVCAWLSMVHGGWILVGGFVALGIAILTGNLLRARQGEVDSGLTTEAAMLVMFSVGAYLPGGHRSVALVIAAATAVLLHLKPQLHAFARRIGERDFRAVMQFVVIALVILPVLPDENFGPFDAFNPRRVWWMVVLITGISLGGYLAHKSLGTRAGTMAGGILGGLISSTATSVTHSRMVRGKPDAAPLAATIILIASAVSFARLMLLVVAADRGNAWAYLPAMCVLLLVLGGFAAVQWMGRRSGVEGVLPAPSNPTELRSALVFTVLYGVVLFAVAAARHGYGKEGLMVVAGLSGLTDMDAITLSMAQLSRDGAVSAGEALRAILCAAGSNFLFKTLVVGLAGGRAVLLRVLPAFLTGWLIAMIWVVWG
jgi:hypothetical protein